ncbi:RNA chaperone Hfq [Bacillus thuringiensis]|uniref:RNA chaperone Hfq n=1 Tax=Bacillus thuringiensis TaxID=1428 RepID=UPI003339A319
METKLQAFQKDRSKNMLSLQEQLLQEAFQKRKDITLILLKGLHVKGMIRGFDTVLLQSLKKYKLIYDI